jgi:DNA-binding transcriptional MocR family regulator
MSRPRVAEMIANEIRHRILDGQLVDGDMLPKVDDLAYDFRVSKPSVREAMRILETEGLISARRGGAGGAEVHMPTADTAAHTLGMILQSTHATLADLATALLALEPTCAAKTAEREDRCEAVSAWWPGSFTRPSSADAAIPPWRWWPAHWSRCGRSTSQHGWSSGTPSSMTMRWRSRC